MTSRLSAFVVAISICVAGASSFACSGSSGGDSTRTVIATSTAALTSSSGTPVIGAGAIREVDLKSAEDVQTLLRETNGEFSPQDVLYADLTDDGVEEALAPVASGGTQGDAAFLVLTPDANGGAATLLSVRAQGGGMSVDIKDGKVVATEARAGPDDPECCPSMLHITTYVWNGSQLVVESAVDVPNPAGSGKATAASGAPPKPNTSQ